MPSIIENTHAWEHNYDWKETGDEWSKPWGGVMQQWYTTLLPRIHTILPAHTILEIGCGHGRWSELLQSHCKQFIGIDLSDSAITACTKRFQSIDHMEFIANDGKSLKSIKDSSVEFVFSYDSLVHADKATLASYIAEFKRILTDTGIAFIHHSNRADYPEDIKIDTHWRDASVNATIVEELAKANELSCIGQEKVSWINNSAYLIDCFSVITYKGSPHDRDNLTCNNHCFFNEIESAYAFSHLYSATTQSE